jgi:hypothetical protein
MAKTFLWIEDRKGKASYIFWENFMKQLYPYVIVESKKNNSELVKSVKALQDIENKYIIVFDNSFDNLQVVMEQKRLKRYVSEKKNVFLLDIICFEYILLEFKELIEWIYAPDDEFLEKRAGTITARHKLVESLQDDNFDYKGIREIVEYDKNIEEHNIEQLSAKLLFDLTRNTGFEVSKGVFGECWIKSCCEWEKRQEDDICGLDNNRLSVFDKMKRIYMGSSLKPQFSKVGLEVVA